MSDISFMMEHTTFFSELLWDVVAVIILIGVVVFFFVRRHQMTQEEQDLEDEISELYADNDRSGSF